MPSVPGVRQTGDGSGGHARGHRGQGAAGRGAGGVGDQEVFRAAASQVALKSG